jgi:hypothetical protein
MSLAGLAFVGLVALGAMMTDRGTNKKSKGKPSSVSSGPWIIERRGMYWDGSKFAKDRRAAASFDDTDSAWDFIDENFNSRSAEDCNLEKKGGTK